MRVRFFSDESGAITVDWVVLTAAFAGLSIAAANEISGGISTMTARLDGELGNSSISGRPATRVLASMSFTDADSENWTGGEVISPIEGLGEMLVVSANETVAFDLEFPDDRDKAFLTFDLIGGDSLDAEVATFKINDQIVTLATGKANGTMDFVSADIDGISITTKVVSEGVNLGGNGPAGWKESITTVTITLDTPGDAIAFSMHSGANQSISDEFFALDNFDLRAQ